MRLIDISFEVQVEMKMLCGKVMDGHRCEEKSS